MNNLQGLSTAWSLFWLQNLMTFVLSVICGWLYGLDGVVAAWMGGLSAILPAAYSAQILFRGTFFHTPRQWANRFKYAQVLKLVSSLVVSSVIFYIIDPLPGIMFVAWGAALMVYRLLPLWTKKQNKMRTELT